MDSSFNEDFEIWLFDMDPTIVDSIYDALNYIYTKD